MEKLVYVALAALVLGSVAAICGLWLLHTAINDGNFWKMLVGVLLTGVGGFYAMASALALGVGR